MQKITQKFMENTSIDINEDVIKVFEFIASPDSVQKMITSTDNGKPALAGIVHELEERFADCEGFPLNHEGPGKNAKNRRNVGWMIRFVMREYGYTPIDNSERTRIGADAGSEYFGNAAVYHFTNSIPNYEIATQAFVLCREMTAKDLYIKKDDPEYDRIRDGIGYINKRRKEMYLGDEFVSTFLNRAGFAGMISIADVELVFRGLKVPCRELYDALNNMIAFFDKFSVGKTMGYHEIYGSSTDKALRAFYSLDIKPEKVQQVFVFFDKWDAILRGFFNLEEDEVEGKLVSLDAPRMIIVTDDNQYWFHGLTTGYAGQGCGGTEEVLLKLGVIEKDKYPVKLEIQTYRVLHYYRENGKWTFSGEDSKRDLHRQDIDSHVNLCRREGKLVLLQALRLKKDAMYKSIEPDLDWLCESEYFMENPTKIRLMSNDEAVKGGYTRNWLTGDEVYQIVISDDYNREIWLTYPFEELGEDRRVNFVAFMDKLGVRFDKGKKSFLDKILSQKQSIYGTYEIGR